MCLNVFSDSNVNTAANNGLVAESVNREITLSDLGPLKDNERVDLNCAVKEYLLLAGYRLTTMTFYEEVHQSMSSLVPYNWSMRVFGLSHITQS